MSKAITLEVVTPEKTVVSEEVQIVVAPGILGDFGALPGHTPFLTPLSAEGLQKPFRTKLPCLRNQRKEERISTWKEPNPHWKGRD